MRGSVREGDGVSRRDLTRIVILACLVAMLLLRRVTTFVGNSDEDEGRRLVVSSARTRAAAAAAVEASERAHARRRRPPLRRGLPGEALPEKAAPSPLSSRPQQRESIQQDATPSPLPSPSEPFSEIVVPSPDAQSPAQEAVSVSASPAVTTTPAPPSPSPIPGWLSSLPPPTSGHEWEFTLPDDGGVRCQWPREVVSAAVAEEAQLRLTVDGVLHASPLAAPSLVAAAVDALHARCAAPVRAFTTYSDDVFSRARRRLVGEALALGDFDVVVELTPADIDPDFRAANAVTLAAERGGGYWLWKPWVANRVLRMLRNDDLLVYLDAGCKIWGTLEPWFAIARQHDPGWVVFEFGEPIPWWTKGDAYAALDLPTSAFADKEQVLGGVWAMRVSPATTRIAHEWLRAAQAPGAINDEPSVLLPNPPGFNDHRHDQSIFTLIIRRENVTTVLKDLSYPEETAKRFKSPVFAARSRD